MDASEQSSSGDRLDSFIQLYGHALKVRGSETSVHPARSSAGRSCPCALDGADHSVAGPELRRGASLAWGESHVRPPTSEKRCWAGTQTGTRRRTQGQPTAGPARICAGDGGRDYSSCMLKTTESVSPGGTLMVRVLRPSEGWRAETLWVPPGSLASYQTSTFRARRCWST